jgi:hypothetical protein
LRVPYNASVLVWAAPAVTLASPAQGWELTAQTVTLTSLRFGRDNTKLGAVQSLATPLSGGTTLAHGLHRRQLALGEHALLYTQRGHP